MASEPSVTEWLQEVQQGAEGEPQEQLVDRYLRRLTALARKQLGGLRAYEDESDVALSAMKSFFMRAPEGEFPQLADRNALWSLLAAITLKKAASLQRRQLAKKRDVRRDQSLNAVLRADPTAEMLDSMIQEANRLLETLQDESLREVARLRMQGYTNQEIAQRIDRSVPTVERKLKLVRKRLRAQLESDNE